MTSLSCFWYDKTDMFVIGGSNDDNPTERGIRKNNNKPLIKRQTETAKITQIHL